MPPPRSDYEPPDAGRPACHAIYSNNAEFHGIPQGRCAMLRAGPVMSNAATPAYLEIIDFIAAGTTPQAVVDYHPSAEARARVAALIAREKEGGLAPEEKAELDHFMDLEHILRMAKARARQILTSGP